MLDRYQVALLRVVRASGELADALKHAARVARALDSTGQGHDCRAERALSEAAALLRSAAALVPGARELFVLALFPATPQEG